MEIDIRPTLGQMLDSYSKLTYQTEYAIAEFIDNSTASYFENEVQLKEKIEDYSLEIHIEYDSNKHELLISDNAFGMTLKRFQEAIVVSNPPDNRSGRNEFGMGLKTAACWFGKQWVVSTTTFDEDYQYVAVVDIDKLIQSKLNTIQIDEVQKMFQTGTRILISKLRKKITVNTFKKLEFQLAGIYRNDIQNESIKIFLNNKRLTYSQPKIYSYVIDGITKVLKREFKSTFISDGVAYSYDGFVAIRSEGKYEETGFTLMRRGRVIVGGYQNAYKPQEIFGAKNSFQSLRIFGEINLDNWPITQAKDQFDWQNSDLELDFITDLKKIDGMNEIINLSKQIRVNEKKEVLEIAESDFEKIAIETHEDIGHLNQYLNEDEPTYKLNILPKIKTYKTIVNYFGNEFVFQVKLEPLNIENIFLIAEKDEYTEIIINTSHTFFEELKFQLDFIKFFQKIIILIILSEKYGSVLMKNSVVSDNTFNIVHENFLNLINIIVKNSTRYKNEEIDI